MLIVGVLVVCSVLVAIIGFCFEAYLDWYIKN